MRVIGGAPRTCFGVFYLLIYPLMNLQTIAKTVLDLIFPVVCISCKTEGSYLCCSCDKQIKRNEFQLCIYCNKQSPFGKTHEACKSDLGIDGLISAVPYKEKLVSKLIEFYKYQFIKDISGTISRFMITEIENQELQNYFADFFVIPLPLHYSKLKWRGFNQSEIIAQQITEHFNWNFHTKLLMRAKKTKKQAELEGQERILNVQDAFLAASDLTGKKIIIVDDVCTTGSTLKEACKALKSAKAQEVWGLVFAQG